MTMELSKQSEQYLAGILAGGMYPSKEAALEAAVEALREKHEEIQFVSDEHMERVEQAIESANAGLATPMTQADWSELRQLANDVAAGKSPSGG